MTLLGLAMIQIEDATREKLMDAAVSCLAEMPLKKITMTHIAGRSGIVRQTVYNYFENKNQLLAATLEREGLKFAQAVAQHINYCESIEDKFIEGFLYVLEYFPKNPILAKVIEPSSDFLATAGMRYSPFSVFSLCYQDIYSAHPTLKEQAEEISEHWIRNCLSFLTMPAGKQRSLDEMREYIRMRLLPGLHLQSIY